jgi:hypothetical protein
MVLLSAQGMDAAAIAKVAFTSEDRVRDVVRNFNADGFSSLYPKYKPSYLGLALVVEVAKHEYRPPAGRQRRERPAAFVLELRLRPGANVSFGARSREFGNPFNDPVTGRKRAGNVADEPALPAALPAPGR